MTKLKLQARLAENLNTIEQLTGKLHQVEKTKSKVELELGEMSVQLDQAQPVNSQMEKRARQYDRLVGDWKTKVESLARELDTAQKDTRNVSSELFRVKNAYEEAVLQLPGQTLHLSPPLPPQPVKLLRSLLHLTVDQL